jgi:hypothetical protein
MRIGRALFEGERELLTGIALLVPKTADGAGEAVTLTRRRITFRLVSGFIDEPEADVHATEELEAFGRAQPATKG